MVPLPLSAPIWGECFTVAPLVVVGTREEDGGHDLAPKHMAMPLGWQNHFGFVCHPSHGTQRNAERTGVFTVSFPRPDSIVEIALTAEARTGGSKPNLDAVPVSPARVVDGVLVDDAHLWLECELERVIDGFGENTLIAGRVVAASVAEGSLRASDVDDAELIAAAPLLAYLAPGRFAAVRQTSSFPFPVRFRL
jgi:flavin reductase (DIM6/NTAB) family NADH-FMN oxidoreductase RutF